MTLRAGFITIVAVAAALLALDAVAWDGRYRKAAWREVEQGGAKFNHQIRYYINKAMR
jgi:hypothetical protein